MRKKKEIPILFDVKEGEIMDIEQFRELFLKRLTIDSESQDKRRKEFNQAIFDKDEGWACFNGIDLEMIMDKFDLAIEDLKKVK